MSVQVYRTFIIMVTLINIKLRLWSSRGLMKQCLLCLLLLPTGTLWIYNYVISSCQNYYNHNMSPHKTSCKRQFARTSCTKDSLCAFSSSVEAAVMFQSRDSAQTSNDKTVETCLLKEETGASRITCERLLCFLSV